MPATVYAHIEIRDGVPFIEGTRAKVVMIAVDGIMRNWDAASIHDDYPHLSLGQIHSAFAYYHDHQAEMDRVIEERARLAEELRATVEQPFTRAELEARLAKKQVGSVRS